MPRPRKTVVVVLLLAGSWWAMMAVHELGHVLGALATGGQVERVVLAPWTIFRTDVAPNPHPLWVAWAGPLFGAVAPLLLLSIVHRPVPLRRVLAFLAGFCLIANGAYVAIGSLDRIGDAGDLMRHGAAAWQLWLFGAVTMPGGLWCWHRLIGELRLSHAQQLGGG